VVKEVPYSIFEIARDVDLVVNTVNTVGYVGKGLAFEFALRCPKMEEAYKRHCASGAFEPGDVWFWENSKPIIANFAVKGHYRLPSNLKWIRKGLSVLRSYCDEHRIRNLALPKIERSSSGLAWNEIKDEIYDIFGYFSDLDVAIALDEEAGPLEKAALQNALNDAEVKITVMRRRLSPLKNPTEVAGVIHPSRFRDLLKLPGVGEKTYRRMIEKYFQIIECGG